MGKGPNEHWGSLQSKTTRVVRVPRALNAVVAASVLAFASGCGSSADEQGMGASGVGGVGALPSTAGGDSGGSTSMAGRAGAGGAAMSLGGGGAGGSAAGTGGSAAGGTAGGSGGSAESSTFSIHIDYMFDSVGAFVPERRAVIEAAARAWQGLVLSEFEDVPMDTLIRTRDPEHFMDPGIVFPAPYTIDDLAVFVGFAAIDGLGMARAKSSFSFTGQVADPVLLAKLDARYNQIPFQPWVGNATFDTAENWFYDPTPDTDDDLPPEQSDFMTTSLHELGHLLGIGNSAAWDSLVKDNHFTGPHAVALNGGPVLVSADLHHIDESLLTNGVRDLMANATADGQRLHPGALDIAILEDLGYTMRH